MVEWALVKFFSSGPELKFSWGGFFFNWEKQLLAMNPGQDLNNHAQIRLSDIL